MEAQIGAGFSIANGLALLFSKIFLSKICPRNIEKHKYIFEYPILILKKGFGRIFFSFYYYPVNCDRQNDVETFENFQNIYEYPKIFPPFFFENTKSKLHFLVCTS